MYSLKELQTEISTKIEYLKANNGPVLHPEWITQAVMADHADIHGKDADFHVCCSRISVRKEVTQQINKTESPSPENQLNLDGFEHLQQYYVVNRDKERVAVRVDDLTDAELEQKASEYDSMGRACLDHADELRRYKDVRKDAPALRYAHSEARGAL